MTMMRTAIAAAGMLAAMPGWAQTYDPEAKRPRPVMAAAVEPERLPLMPLPFTGATIGLETGWIQSRYKATYTFYDSSGEIPTTVTGPHSKGGLGGGAFAGYDFAIAPAVRLGGEIAVAFGGSTNAFTFDNRTYAQRPHYGMRFAVRAGYVFSPRVMSYGTIGYGFNMVGITDGGIGVMSASTSPSGIELGAGAEYRIDRRLGLRLDFKHVDDSSNQLFVGLPVRF